MIRFLTISDPFSREAGKCDRYVESIRRFGFEPTVLESWSPELGFFSKLAVHSYVEATPWSDEDLIAFTDGHDVMMINDPRTLEDLPHYYECEILLAAETGYSHHRPENQDYFDETFRDKPSRYPNTGMILGKKSAFCETLRSIEGSRSQFPEASEYENEQMLIGEFYVENRTRPLIRHRLALDTESRAITTLSSKRELSADLHSVFAHVTWLDNPLQFSKWLELYEIYGDRPGGASAKPATNHET